MAIEYDKHADPIKYYLEYNSPESEAFEITDANREDGVITVKEAVDRETYQSITLTVRAEDSGPNPLSNFAEIHVTIEDVNDNRSGELKSNLVVTATRIVTIILVRLCSPAVGSTTIRINVLSTLPNLFL